MPPVQCPNCGRFLRNAFVASLADAPAPCPGCDLELRPELFDGDAVSDVADASADVADAVGEDASRDGAAEPAPASPTERAERELHREQPAAAAGEGSSVRPPDLEPTQVRDDDVLRGWDVGEAVRAAGPGEDQRPFPTDTVIVVGAGAAGLLLGATLGRDRRVTAGAAGAAAGVLAAAIVRRIWRLEP